MIYFKLAAYGVAVFVLYGTLFYYEEDIIRLCKKGGWYFLFPVSVAFVFSFFHGAFTGMFWDALGVKARQSK